MKNNTKLTDAQKGVQKRMVEIIRKRNDKGQGWSMPESYNSNWTKAMEDAIGRKMVRVGKDGAWLVKK